jgi:hypothetical protein
MDKKKSLYNFVNKMKFNITLGKNELTSFI